MYTAYPYNPASTIHVEEQVSVVDNKAFLRHIPKQGSIEIDGFTETTGTPIGKQFYCDYATDSFYRDANRVLHFGSVDDYTFLTVNYIAVGTVLTADIWNEIKAHLEDSSVHGGDSFFHKVANFVCFPYVTGNEDSWSVARYEHDFQDYAGRPSQNYDIVFWNNSGTVNGWAIRVDDKWINLGVDSDTSWAGINPILSVKDRQKLDDKFQPAFYFAEYTDSDVESGEFSPALIFIQKCLADKPANAVILAYRTGIDERQTAIDNDEEVNEEDYKENYQLLVRDQTDPRVQVIYDLGSEWGDICPILTVADRKLLDYLHELYDEHIP